ncbi:MAG: sulfatase-like hydrolase/transferase [Gammaproteobacteria bacterium]|nr:sulfatase-like hydrolase/transferase [Gammaproteobacteria bacterium]
MPRRTIGILACLLAFRVLATPNVILVMGDDMGWAQTGYYDHPVLETPNLDAMAANGLRMDRFYSAAPQCSTARATVLTGRTNDRTGVATVGSSINKQEKTPVDGLSQRRLYDRTLRQMAPQHGEHTGPPDAVV